MCDRFGDSMSYIYIEIEVKARTDSNVDRRRRDEAKILAIFQLLI